MHLKRDSAPAPEHLIEDVDVAAPNDPAGKSASRPAGCARRPVSVRLSDREVAIVSAAAAAKIEYLIAYLRLYEIGDELAALILNFEQSLFEFVEGC